MNGEKQNRILLAHGDGGLLTHELVTGLFARHFRNGYLEQMGDAALVPLPAGRIALTTDSFVVNPVFFPGGDIGKLAVCGTVNDLAVCGAVPRYLSASFILEEGLDTGLLEKIVVSMARAAGEAGVQIVTGDTKVVERGNADQLYINTTGVGLVPDGIDLGHHRVRPGDRLIINGNVGEHGIAVLSQRQGLAFDSPVISDCAPLGGLITELLGEFKSIKFMRDPTRGGVATTVKELALASRTDIVLFEECIPVSPEVAGAAEMLGLDPLYLANEGKVIIAAAPEEAQNIVNRLQRHPLGKNAALIGEIQEGRGDVYLRTLYGGSRYVDLLYGQQLPRIC